MILGSYQARDLQRQVLREKHPDMSNLALMYQEQGQRREAESKLKPAGHDTSPAILIPDPP